MAIRTHGIHHIAVLVEDLLAARHFYEGVLGLPVERVNKHDDGSTRSIWLDAGGCVLMLEEATDSARRSEGGGGWRILSLRIRKSDRDGIIETLGDSGVPLDSSTPHTLYVRDPEGNLVGLSHWPD